MTTNADTGLGTTYERWALNRLLFQIRQNYQFTTLLEGPGDGMTGIAGLISLALCRDGVNVTLLLPSSKLALSRQAWQVYSPNGSYKILEVDKTNSLPFDAASYDLVWNFNVMNSADDPERLLAEICRVSRHFVLIFVPNRYNYGFPLHRLHHQKSRQPWDHGPLELLEVRGWRSMFGLNGYRVLKTFWVDCPWWPDIIDINQFLVDIFPWAYRWGKVQPPENRMCWEIEDLPYFDAVRYAPVHARMKKLAWIEERFPDNLKRFFAHHVGILAKKNGK